VRTKIILALGLAVLSSACDKKAEGQTVAVVNGEEITAAELNAELASARLPEGMSQKDARARVLQAIVDRRLVAAALSAVPHRALHLGVSRAEQRRYGTPADHARWHGLDAAGLRASINTFLPAGRA